MRTVLAWRTCRHLQVVAATMAMVMALTSLPVGTAAAALIGTEEALASAAPDEVRDRLAGLLGRVEVRDQLAALGVDPEEAAARVASLSDREISEIAGRLEQLPAGEGAVGTVLGAALLIFLVLLVTDLLGLTDVYPFVRR